MNNQEHSRKLILLYTLSYCFIILSAVIGVNLNKQTLAKSNNITNSNVVLVEEAEAPSEPKVIFGKKYNYAAVTTINEVTDTQEDESSIIATNLAKSILDGSWINDFLQKNSLLIDTEKLNIVNFSEEQEIKTAIFSGDLLVLDEFDGENIVIGDFKEESQESSHEELLEEPEPISPVVIEEPSQEIAVEIIDTTPLLDENGSPINYVRYIDCTATAYCLCKKCTGKTPDSPGYGRTASGHVIKPGQNEKIIAVDRNQIPLGTNVYIQGLNGAPSYGFALAADTGGAIKGNKIDLYYDSHADCLKWGRRQVRVYILPD